MTQSINVRRQERRWSDVDNRVFADKRLSLSARLVLAWLLGRSENYVVKVGWLHYFLGLTDKTWPRIRRELEAVGYYQATRFRDASGKIQWDHSVTDAPLDEVRLGRVSELTAANPSPQNGRMDIPGTPPSLPNGGMADTIPPKRMDGGGRDAEQRDLLQRTHNTEKTTTTTTAERTVVLTFSDGSQCGQVPPEWAELLQSEAESAKPNTTLGRYAAGILRKWSESGKPIVSRKVVAKAPRYDYTDLSGKEFKRPGGEIVKFKPDCAYVMQGSGARVVTGQELQQLAEQARAGELGRQS